MNETGPPDPPSRENQKKRLAEEQSKRRSPSQLTNPKRQGSLKPQNRKGGDQMDEKAKGEIAVGSNIRLRDGRQGKVTELEGNRLIMTADDGTKVEAPTTEAAAEDESAARADEGQDGMA